MIPVAAVQRSVVTRSLRRAMSAYAGSTPFGSVDQMPGMTLISSGIDYPVFNATVISASAGAADFGDKVAMAARHYQRKQIGWSCWYCDELTGASRAEIARVLKRASLRRVAEHQAMVAERVLPPRNPLPDLEARPVVDERTRVDFISVCTRVFGLPVPVGRQVYGSERFWLGAYRGWVGYRHGDPICIAATESDADGVGLYSVGTLESFRGRGYGEQITRVAIRHAAGSAGCERTMLQATRAGLRLYARMGFEVTGRISVYASR
ncbi:MAG: GNAT family N-acetyltransferase [Bryobacteraceae bacterium]